MGDYLTTGYDLYFWEETRTPGQTYGSGIFKPNEYCSRPWEKVYDGMAVMKDGYGEWGFTFVAGDNLIARLSPLTLSMTLATMMATSSTSIWASVIFILHGYSKR